MSEKQEQGVLSSVEELMRLVEKERVDAAGKYVLNKDNLEKFNRVYDLFLGVAEENGGGLNAVDVAPASICASVSMEIPSLDMRSEGSYGLKAFVGVMQYMNTLDFGSNAAGNVVIGTSVNNVWEAVA